MIPARGVLAAAETRSRGACGGSTKVILGGGGRAPPKCKGMMVGLFQPHFLFIVLGNHALAP